MSTGLMLSLDGQKLRSPIINLFWLCEMHGFQGNPLCNFKEWGCTYKILISQQQLVLEA